MKAFAHFTNEINKLIAFYKATVYAYDQAELSILYKKKAKIPYDTETADGFKILTPNYFKIKRNAKRETRQNLNEILYVRIISALEVFLIDIIRDIFLITKEPFKRNDLRLELNHAELLSISSTAEISSKIINKECRKLTSAGYEDIVKYYRRHFNIDLDSFAPGKTKIEEYHDRRHILVHRLGKTDAEFRKKYNYSKNGISIDEDYLFNSIENFKGFASLINSQVKYYLKNEIPAIIAKNEKVERRVKLEIRDCDELPDFFNDNFEFWVDDEFRMLKDIIIRREYQSPKDFDITIAGTFREIKSFMTVVRRDSRKIKYEVTEINEYVRKPEIGSQVRLIKLLDAEILEQVKNELPAQPWEKGIHKIVAEKLGTTNKLVSIAIQHLIANKVFKPQVDGIILDHKE
jgi:hypothetical protein